MFFWLRTTHSNPSANNWFVKHCQNLWDRRRPCPTKLTRRVTPRFNSCIDKDNLGRQRNEPNASKARPNIVWIVSEDNSMHYLEHFFEGGAKAPNIESRPQAPLPEKPLPPAPPKERPNTFQTLSIPMQMMNTDGTAFLQITLVTLLSLTWAMKRINFSNF